MVSCSLNYDRSEIFTQQILYNFNKALRFEQSKEKQNPLKGSRAI